MENNIQDSNNMTQEYSDKKKILMIAGLSFFIIILAVITSIAVSQKNNSYDSEAKGRIVPTQAVMQQPTLTVTPGPINSEEELTNALEELENANSQAVNSVQTQLNELDTESTQATP